MNAPNQILDSRARAALKAQVAAMPMSPVTSAKGNGVATLETAGLRPIVTLLLWNPVDGLVAERRAVPERALPGKVFAGHKDAVQMAVDATEQVPVDHLSNVGFSEALEWFGLRDGFGCRYADRFADSFAAANPDVDLPRDYVRDMVGMRVSEAIGPEVRKNLDVAALSALRCAASFPKGPYAFFAGNGSAREFRHQAANVFPLLAKEMASKITTKSAIDRKLPLNAALETAFGADEAGKPRLGKALLRRLQAASLPDKGVPSEVLVDALSGLPPDWFPKDAGEWDAFADVADTFLRYLPPIVGERPEALAAGCSGKWAQFRSRVAKSAVNTQAPEDLVDPEERARWRPVPDESKEGLSGACQMVLDMVAQFRDLVVLPVAAMPLGSKDAYLSEETRRAGSQVAGRILCRGKALPAILEAARHWHTQMENIRAATEDADEAREARERDAGRHRGEMKVVAADGWAPMCDVYVAPNGVTVMPLTDPRELKDEGAGYGSKDLSKDANGVEGLQHCVGGYAQTCRTQGHHIVSFRTYAEGTYKRLSTAEFDKVPAESNTLRCVQHHGRGNGQAPPEAKAAYDWFVQEIKVGNIPINRDGIMSYMAGRRQVEDDVTVQSGYDRKDPALVALALGAWDLYLNKRFRGATPEALRAMPEMDAVNDLLAPSYAPAPR